MTKSELRTIRIKMNKKVYELLEIQEEIGNSMSELYELLEKDMNDEKGIQISNDNWPRLGSAVSKICDFSIQHEEGIKIFNEVIKKYE